MKKCFVALLMLMAACGSEPPPPAPIAQKPAPVERPDTGGPSAAADADEAQRAFTSIENATTEDEANLARQIYKGRPEAARLDRELSRKLFALDFAQLTAVIAEIRKAETPDAADEVARDYFGTRYSADLNVALDEHVAALIKKNPTLRRTGKSASTNKPTTPDQSDQPEKPESTRDSIDELAELLGKCTTETEAAAAIASYKGAVSDLDKLVALERWRWAGLEEISRFKTASPRDRWNDNDIFDWKRVSQHGLFVPNGSQSIDVLDSKGSLVRTLKHEGTGLSTVAGVSPDGQFAYTCCSMPVTGSNLLKKWDVNSGELVLGFVSATKSAALRLVPELNPEGTRMICWFMDNTAILFDTDTGETVKSFGPYERFLGMIGLDGDFIYLRLARDIVAIAQESGEEAWRYDYSAAIGVAGAVGPNRRIAVCPGNPLPAARAEDGEPPPPPPLARGSITVIDGATGKKTCELALDSAITGLKWLESGRHLLVFSHNGVSLVDAEAGVVVSHVPNVVRVDLSLDMRLLTTRGGFKDKDGYQQVKTYGRKP